MAENLWAEQVIGEFFSTRKSPTRSECDQLALSISGASSVRAVSVPGSLSYTVICTGAPCQNQEKRCEEESTVVSFRLSEAGIDTAMVELARTIHGRLVPKTTWHGIMRHSEPPLGIYAMSLLPGVACLEVLSYQADMDADEEARHVRFVVDLARYFARCWSAPQTLDVETRAKLEAGISRRLAAIKASSSDVSMSTLSDLENTLPMLFSREYPQVLTHGDFTKTNVLVHPDTYEITGIVDWSLVSALPFGMELDCLFLMTGCMDLGGWHDYACRSRLWEAFWDEFWTASGIDEDHGGVRRRESIRSLAETAATIGAILRYGFDRCPDGRPSEVLTTSEAMTTMLRAWLGS